jgi:hypothetical protein
VEPQEGSGELPPPPAGEPAAIEEPAAPPPTTRQLALAVVAGLAAAIVGGIIWGMISAATESEFGIAAIGIGILTGFAVVFAARGSAGVPLQVIAALTAVVGVLWGKYYAFVQVFQDVAEEQPDAGISVPLFSGDTFRVFMDASEAVFSGWDIAWIGFAIYTAWRIPEGKGFGRWASGRRAAPGG